MDARQLVGMTQGAKKRAARVETRGYGEDTSTPRLRRWVVNLWHLGNGSTDPKKLNRMAKFSPEPKRSPEYAAGERYAEVRAAYRIGERLRLCSRCLGRPAFREATAGKTPCFECNGSGVLPARRGSR